MKTRHFDAVDWLDFARGVATTIARRSMERHLADGCGRCARQLDRARALVTAARTTMVEPPPSVVRLAESIFSAHTLQRPARGLAGLRVAARLMFDSFQTPVPLGVRSARQAERHVLYRAGDFDVDLRLEYETPASGLAVVGQVVNRRDPGRPVVGARARLVAGDAVVADAEANEFGEFELRGPVTPRVRLEVPVDSAGRWVDVPLGRLSSGPSTTGARRRRTGGSTVVRKGVRK